jgi:putative endonuclease
MHYVCVIRSKQDGSFYVGETLDITQRLRVHNSQELNKGKTRLKIPWELFFVLETDNRTISIKIEKHIKRMKSRKYLEDLKKYPEIGQRLIEKYL